jgi:hypothetical protein
MTIPPPRTTHGICIPAGRTPALTVVTQMVRETGLHGSGPNLPERIFPGFEPAWLRTGVHQCDLCQPNHSAPWPLYMVHNTVELEGVLSSGKSLTWCERLRSPRACKPYFDVDSEHDAASPPDMAWLDKFAEERVREVHRLFEMLNTPGQVPARIVVATRHGYVPSKVCSRPLCVCG